MQGSALVRRAHPAGRSRLVAALGAFLIVALAIGVPAPARAVTNGGATKLAFLADLFGGTPGTPIVSSAGPYFEVAVQDANGNTIATDQTTAITVAIGTNPTDGAIMGPGPVTVVNGIATFSNTSIDRVGNGYTLVASSSPSLTQATSSTFDINPGEADHLAFSTQPGGGSRGAAWVTQPAVSFIDTNGYPTGSGTDPVTIAITQGTGTQGAVLTCAGGLTVAAVAGVATFSGCSIDLAGTGYTLTATSGQFLGAGVSASFAITSGPAPTPTPPGPTPTPPGPTPTPTPQPRPSEPAFPVLVATPTPTPIPTPDPAPRLKVGDSYGGGTVAYVLTPGDPGYVTGDTRAIVAAPEDATPSGGGVPWSLFVYQQVAVPSGTGSTIGSGATNTDHIVAQNGPGTLYAAGVARAYRGGGYSDWYLPSRDELAKLIENEAAIGGLPAPLYWSSSQAPVTIQGTTAGNTAWSLAGKDGAQTAFFKYFWLAVRPVRSVSVRSDAEITSFTFPGLRRSSAVIDHGARTVAVSVPLEADLTSLIAKFTYVGASVKVGSAVQVSGTTANGFATSVTYTVTAEDGTTRDYVVTVTARLAVGDPYGGGVVGYLLQPGDPGYEAGKPKGLIAATGDQSAGIVWALGEHQTQAVPGGTGSAIGTGATNTNRIIAQNGPGTGYAAGLARAYRGGGYDDWYLPSKDELYRLFLDREAIGGFGGWFPSYWSSSQHDEAVIMNGVVMAPAGSLTAVYAWKQSFYPSGAQDGSMKQDPAEHVRAVRSFAVTSDKAITAFSFDGLAKPAVGVVDATTRTIAVTVPYGTDLTALVSTFSINGYGALVGTVLQVSGTTPHDFTAPLTYTVLGADGSKATWTVTVTPGLAIGDSYGGGIVAYILKPGDPGYAAGKTKGIIAAAADLGDMIPWWNWTYVDTGATGTALGDGAADTATIIAAQGAPGLQYAAYVADAYRGGGFDDWYLPSRDELAKLYAVKDVIDATSLAFYWSASEDGQTTAWCQRFDDGTAAPVFKFFAAHVRPVRAFTQ